MDLTSLQRQWERFGKEDPLWSNLSCPEKRHGLWEVREFFETGVQEIGSLMAHVETLHPPVGRVRALDFGCGVGRLTQALCQHFESCDGVDIAPSMIQLARQYNRWGDRCRYHVNERSDLKIFEDGAFDLVYTNIVLQHMEPALAEGYVREFLRVINGKGVAVFQLPDERGARRPDSGVKPQPLSPRGFSAEILPEGWEGKVLADTDVVLAVRVRNTSQEPWPAAGAAGGRFQVNLANHWRDRRGRVLVVDDGRAQLPYALPPGADVVLNLWVRTPAKRGRYILELDMVQEGVAWFAQRGSRTVRIPVDVEGSESFSWPWESVKKKFFSKRKKGLDSSPGEPGTKLLMFGTSPEKVRDWVESAGGVLIDVRDDGVQGEWPGYFYTAGKPEFRASVDLSLALRSVRARDELRFSFPRAEITSDRESLVARPGEKILLRLKIKNLGRGTWHTEREEPALPVRVGNHWLDVEGRVLRKDDGRASFSRELRPQEEAEVSMTVSAPDVPGNYLLELDLVKERVGWFQEFGSKTTRIPVEIRETTPG